MIVWSLVCSILYGRWQRIEALNVIFEVHISDSDISGIVMVIVTMLDRRLKFVHIVMVTKWAKMAEFGRPGCFKFNEIPGRLHATRILLY